MKEFFTAVNLPEIDNRRWDENYRKFKIRRPKIIVQLMIRTKLSAGGLTKQVIMKLQKFNLELFSHIIPKPM